LRGHTASVTALDWAADASTSGLLATGGDDGRIYVWKCFAKPSYSIL
jgi:WD40 repeat protein